MSILFFFPIIPIVGIVIVHITAAFDRSQRDS